MLFNDRISVSLRPQLVAARYPDGAPHAAGVSGLHADAVRHVLQHVDLSRGHRGLRPGLFHLFPSPGSDVTVWTGIKGNWFLVS